ncbi:uncharacterized protein LOC114629464 [Grammomys surdaster]|uniref:uncharacterized protein LOC114629464 n=1 Tax=Grammomys surdaster TaxID=491861 RepID=UPI00109F4913|nr:uncharacterized protein LOC114629464 [Grammomys surdaster]
MPTNEVPKMYILKEETNAMGAAQIMLGLIHSALGILWLSLYQLEEKKHSIGCKLMISSICYLFVSGTFFIYSGSSSITQGGSSKLQRLFAVIGNTSSIFMALFGSMLLGYEFPIFESKGIEYIWSNMAGMMLLQISVISTIAELIIAIIVLHWFTGAHEIEVYSEEISLGPSNSELPSPLSKQPSLLELETMSDENEEP